jgi:hypothetical protein
MSNPVSANASTNGGIGFTGLLTIAFIVLKLCGVITWSWVWVLSPMWIVSLGLLGALVLIGIVVLIASMFAKGRK